MLTEAVPHYETWAFPFHLMGFGVTGLHFFSFLAMYVQFSQPLLVLGAKYLLCQLDPRI